MECGRLTGGLRWLAITHVNTPLAAQNATEDNQVHDNYTVTFPDSESEIVDGDKNINSEFELSNQYYENPLFIPAREVLNEEISVDTEQLMKSEAKNFEDYKFCGAVNDFDIELEAGEAVPIVYLSSSRAAKLQRALRLGGYKKVSSTY